MCVSHGTKIRVGELSSFRKINLEVFGLCFKFSVADIPSSPNYTIMGYAEFKHHMEYLAAFPHEVFTRLMNRWNI